MQDKIINIILIFHVLYNVKICKNKQIEKIICLFLFYSVSIVSIDFHCFHYFHSLR